MSAERHDQPYGPKTQASESRLPPPPRRPTSVGGSFLDESDDDIGMEASDLLRHATQTWTLRSRIKLTQLEADLAALKTRVEVLQGVLRLVARR